MPTHRRAPTPKQDEQLVVRTASAEQTRALGRRLAGRLRPGDVLALGGTFGAGKTTLVQGIAEGLGSREWLASPSFALANEYLPAETGVRLPLFHLDLYRLGSAEEAFGIGLDEYVARAGVLVVEWPVVGLEALPPDRVEIELGHEGAGRRIVLRGRGTRAAALVEALAAGET
jgi:tRNA threonylcarbamoyladenosine biosynthesis protein TsaE